MSAAGALAFVRGNWRWLVAGFALAALGVWGVIQRSNAMHWEKVAIGRAAEIDRMQREAAEQAAANAQRLAAATSDFAAHAVAREPIIIRSKETVREYAQTDAGRGTCLGADRVRGIDALDRALGDPGRAGGGEGAVPDPADPAPARR